jgi:ATP-dependent Clp protease ATP-binding subunit ClpB
LHRWLYADTSIQRKLTHDNIKGIINVRLREIEGRLSEQKLTLEISPEAKAALVDKGYSPVYGARPLNRIIQQEVQSVTLVERHALKLCSC